ncbi:MAG: DUF4476 domain-containing protein [Planctomycetales bacterium]|nr:DUF4476 domain-containing protein [Planctomycetales bacterium]
MKPSITVLSFVIGFSGLTTATGQSNRTPASTAELQQNSLGVPATTDQTALAPSELAIQASEQLAATLSTLRSEVSTITDAALKDRLNQLVLKAEMDAALLKSEIKERAQRAATFGKHMLADDAFQEFTASVKAASFSSQQIQLIKTLVEQLKRQQRFMTCEQVAVLLAIPSFDRDRVELAVLLYGVVADPENFHSSLSVLQYDSSRRQVWQQIRERAAQTE